MTWVVSDYIATPGTNEVSVTKGQQVEIIDTNCNGAPEFCLVRLNIHSGSAADGSGTIEGKVPVSVLKFAPTKSGHRKGADTTADNKDSENNGKFLLFKKKHFFFFIFSFNFVPMGYSNHHHHITVVIFSVSFVGGFFYFIFFIFSSFELCVSRF